MKTKIFIFSLLLFITACNTSVSLKFKDELKDGDIVEVIGGAWTGYIGYCKHTDDETYSKGLRFIVLKIGPDGRDVLEGTHIEWGKLKKTNKWIPKYQIPYER